MLWEREKAAIWVKVAKVRGHRSRLRCKVEEVEGEEAWLRFVNKWVNEKFKSREMSQRK